MNRTEEAISIIRDIAEDKLMTAAERMRRLGVISIECEKLMQGLLETERKEFAENMVRKP